MIQTLCVYTLRTKCGNCICNFVAFVRSAKNIIHSKDVICLWILFGRNASPFFQRTLSAVHLRRNISGMDIHIVVYFVRVSIYTWTPNGVACCGTTLFPYLINNHRFVLFSKHLQSSAASTQCVRRTLPVICIKNNPFVATTCTIWICAILQLHNRLSVLLLVGIHHMPVRCQNFYRHRSQFVGDFSFSAVCRLHV